MNGVVDNSLFLNALLRHKNKIKDTLDMISLYEKSKTVAELIISLQKDLDVIEEQIKEVTK